MKKHLLKIVLPAFAILLAVGLAFATEEKAAFQQGHYFDTSVQQWKSITVEEDCDDQGEIPCLHEGYQLYSMPSFGSTPLKKNES